MGCLGDPGTDPLPTPLPAARRPPLPPPPGVPEEARGVLRPLCMGEPGGMEEESSSLSLRGLALPPGRGMRDWDPLATPPRGPPLPVPVPEPLRGEPVARAPRLGVSTVCSPGVPRAFSWEPEGEDPAGDDPDAAEPALDGVPLAAPRPLGILLGLVYREGLEPNGELPACPPDRGEDPPLGLEGMRVPGRLEVAPSRVVAFSVPPVWVRFRLPLPPAGGSPLFCTAVLWPPPSLSPSPPSASLCPSFSCAHPPCACSPLSASMGAASSVGGLLSGSTAMLRWSGSSYAFSGARIVSGSSCSVPALSPWAPRGATDPAPAIPPMTVSLSVSVSETVTVTVTEVTVPAEEESLSLRAMLKTWDPVRGRVPTSPGNL